MRENFNIKDSLIKEELLEKFPDWWKTINPDEHYLVCTDDCDSLFSCERLHSLFGLEIGGYYSFENGLYLNDLISDFGWKTPVYVDLSIGQNQLCFDNHRTFLNNPNRVNPNVIPMEYKNKYNFGTITLIAALYGGVDKMNEKLRTMLIAVDGGFIGYYKDDGRWKDVNLYWLEKLGLTEYLVPILEKYDMKYFQDFSIEHGLYDKIIVNEDGYLETPTYQVPDCKFELIQPIEKVIASSYEVTERLKKKEKILVSAETYKNSYVLNIAV